MLPKTTAGELGHSPALIVQSGNVSVTYVNADGQLNISINTPSGSTTLALPTGD